MKLKEYEAKQLLKNVGISISEGTLIKKVSELPQIDKEMVFKVQTLAGGRGKSGGISIIGDHVRAKEFCHRFFHQVFLGEEIHEILVDEKISIEKELYLGVMFDTSKKCPVLIFSEEGGIDIEQVQSQTPDEIIVIDLDFEDGLTLQNISEIINNSTLDDHLKKKLADIIKKLYECFITFDCQMIEINPLVVTKGQNLKAVDAVIVLDDNAKYRREINFPERTGRRKATRRELEARKIDEEDHRGVAGKTFLELDGDIGILASGGGASITLMDSLISFEGKPANYTEYSGNPSPEKVEKLTRVVLSIPKLSGLLVAGVIANFTNIAETMKGILIALVDLKPDFPIVVRRAGPHDGEARTLLMEAKEKYGLDIHYFDETTPMTKAAEIIVTLSNEYKEMKENGNIN